VQELIESRPGAHRWDSSKQGALHLRRGQKITVEITERPPIRRCSESIPSIALRRRRRNRHQQGRGMTVHAGAGNVSGTLVNALLGRGKRLRRRAIRLRPGIVHRLDKEPRE